VSVPPQREPGTVRFPSPARPNPRTDFLVTAAEPLADERAFIGALDAGLAGPDANGRNVSLFVHGFNTNFAEGLYRQAQLQHDFDRRGASVHFSWPSAGRTLGYLADREAALFSRDGLEATIGAIARSQARTVDLIGHSMGAFLLMETLRTMARAGEDRTLARVNSVLLIAPDIEIDVFRQQARPLIDRGVPIYVMVSDADRALALSARIRGERKRLGSISGIDELDGLDVTVIDLGQLERNDRLGHFKLGTSPELIAFVRGLQLTGLQVFAGRQRGVIQTSVAFIQAGTDILIAPLVAGEPPGGF
jgi:esterase/lipase superfamily enzyme